MKLKIPFGKHKVTGKFVDAASVPKGKNCSCICNECGTGLIACHRTNLNWKSYFRHECRNNCTGGLESLFHSVAKQILKESNILNIGRGISMPYEICDIETPRHGKRPDAYISNPHTSLIVEIFFYHRIEQSTLDIFLEQGEKVLEIDISAQKENLFDYGNLKELVLQKAPRKSYPQPGANEMGNQNSRDDKSSSWPIELKVLIGLALTYIVVKLTGRSGRY